MDDAELLTYLETIIKERPRFETYYNNVEGYIVRCNYITGIGKTLRYAIQDYKVKRDIALELLKKECSKNG